MALPKEAIEKITTFYRGKNEQQITSRGDVIGQVEGRQLVYDTFRYQLRAEHIKETPLVCKLTVQPVLALVSEQRVTTLAYAADVGRLEESTVKAITELIDLEHRQNGVGHDWPEDY